MIAPTDEGNQTFVSEGRFFFWGILETMKNFFEEFKKFAMRGNALDLAVGVVIGGAFGQITASLANNVLTPPIGLLLGGVNFSKLALPLGGNASIGYGIFLQALINFVVIAFALFLLVRVINRFIEKPAPPAAPAESPELAVLKEIRDKLAERS